MELNNRHKAKGKVTTVALSLVAMASIELLWDGFGEKKD